VTQRTILITHSDMNRLHRLLESALNFLRRDRPHLETLEHELDHARVVPTEEIPQNVVMLNSRVRLRDLDTGVRKLEIEEVQEISRAPMPLEGAA